MKLSYLLDWSTRKSGLFLLPSLLSWFYDRRFSALQRKDISFHLLTKEHDYVQFASGQAFSTIPVRTECFPEWCDRKHTSRTMVDAYFSRLISSWYRWCLYLCQHDNPLYYCGCDASIIYHHQWFTIEIFRFENKMSMHQCGYPAFIVHQDQNIVPPGIVIVLYRQE